MMGPNVSPSGAAIAPLTPQNREPTQTDTLMILGPGTIWQIPRMALNSSELSTFSFSTNVRLVQGRTPPKPDMPILLKIMNNWSGVSVLKIEILLSFKRVGGRFSL